MKKFFALMYMVFAVSITHANTISFFGSIDSASARYSMPSSATLNWQYIQPATVSGGFSGSLSLNEYGDLDYGALNISYSQSNCFNTACSSNSYNNMVYSLTPAFADAYNSETGTLLQRYDFGFAVSNTAWQAPIAQLQPVRNTNGNYLGYLWGNNAWDQNGVLIKESGTTTCTGVACPSFPVSSLGMEGLSIILEFDQQNNHAFLGGKIIIQEVYTPYTTNSAHITTLGSIAPDIPVPAAAWLMGSGLIGLAGIARRKK